MEKANKQIVAHLHVQEGERPICYCRGPEFSLLIQEKGNWPKRLKVLGAPSFNKHLRWLNRVMQDHEARASDLNQKLIFSFILLFS